MQEIIVDILLAVVIVTAAVFRFVIGARPDGSMTRKQKVMLVRILIASSILLVLQLIPTELFSRLDGVLFSSAGRWLRFALYLADYFIIGYDILRKAIRGILNRQVFDENFLMAVATVGAMALAIYENGDYLEAIAVMLFYQIGEWFQSYAVGRSRRSISDLMDIRPDYANIEQDGDLEQVDPDEVEIGSIIVVQPGEKVPIDGIVAEGSSTLNTSALTGESLPREVQTGDEIISGCINMTGVLKIRTTKEFGESTVSKILDLVENASSRKSRSEDFISKFARIYTPAVCYSALALAILPPLVRMLAMGLSADWGTWVYRALTFLVISCPCALVISIPLSFFAGIGGASREGVLVKGSNYLEILSQTKTVVFDKTGTLTQGTFEVSGIHHSKRIRRPGGERLLPPHQQEPAAGLRKDTGPLPGEQCEGDQRTGDHRNGGRHGSARRQHKAYGSVPYLLYPLPPRGHHHPYGPQRQLCGTYPHLRHRKVHLAEGHCRAETVRCGTDRHAHRRRQSCGRSGGGTAPYRYRLQRAAAGG